MKIARYDGGSGATWGFVEDDKIASAADADLRNCLRDRSNLDAAHAQATERVSLASVTLLAPVPEPPQFLGVGLN